jgi:hypothetical protein
LPQSCTTLAERFLLATAIIIEPLEKHIPTVAGMSVSFLIFAVLAAYVIVNRQRHLLEIWYHPVFIAAYAFVGVTILLEFSSPLSRYEMIIRFGQMIGGAVCVAVLCRDRSGLTAGLCGYIGAALWVSAFLYLTSYGTLQGMGEVSDFNEASKLRGEAFGNMDLRANINQLAFVCTQGAIIAFALLLSDRLKHLRILLLGIGIYCIVAAFLPMSRGTAMISFVSVATILYAYGVKQGKALILVSVLGLGIYILVPDAVWSRMSFSTEAQNGKVEARAHIYTTALNHLPEYIVAGVGAGHYYGHWGIEKGFFRASASGRTLGAHNALLQITIFWGALGLLMYLWIAWFIYRCIPLRCGRDELSLALLGVIVSLGTLLFVSHVYYDKWFAFGVGMLVGARQWIWPTGIVPAVEVNERLSPRSSMPGN